MFHYALDNQQQKLLNRKFQEGLNYIALQYYQLPSSSLSFCADAIIVQSGVHYWARKKSSPHSIGLNTAHSVGDQIQIRSNAFIYQCVDTCAAAAFALFLWYSRNFHYTTLKPSKQTDHSLCLLHTRSPVSVCSLHWRVCVYALLNKAAVPIEKYVRVKNDLRALYRLCWCARCCNALSTLASVLNCTNQFKTAPLIQSCGLENWALIATAAALLI